MLIDGQLQNWQQVVHAELLQGPSLLPGADSSGAQLQLLGAAPSIGTWAAVTLAAAGADAAAQQAGAEIDEAAATYAAAPRVGTGAAAAVAAVAAGDAAAAQAAADVGTAVAATAAAAITNSDAETAATTAASTPTTAAATAAVRATPAAPLPPLLRASQQHAEQLRYELLRVATFWYGDATLEEFQKLADLIRSHNLPLPAGSPDRVVVHHGVLEAKWAPPVFMRRGPLHLLVSEVEKWGEGVSNTVPGWPVGPGLRGQLLQRYKDLTIELGGEQGWLALLDSENGNWVRPFGTAAHYCIPEAVDFLLAQPELTVERMRHGSKHSESS
jgi:hypothetical protein